MSLNNNSSPQWGINKWGLWILCILIFILLVYLPLHQNNFLISWDDNRYVLDNPHIKALNLNSIIQTFSIFYDGHYHPLTLLSLAVDYQLSGLNPRGYHVTNLVLHLINTFLVFWLVFLLFEKRDRTIPLVTALLFGISTIHVITIYLSSH